ITRTVPPRGCRAWRRDRRITQRHARRDLPGARRSQPPPAGGSGMNMRSPLIAMLWENWRLSRVEAAQRLALGIVAGSAALVLWESRPIIAFWILLSQHGMFYFSISKLNGGTLLDGYKPGFPLPLLYTRPVRTAVFVGIAMAYDAISCAALYVVSASVLGFVFGQTLPLLSVAAWIVTFHLICTAVQWSTRSRVVQWVASFVLCVPPFILLAQRAASSLQVRFSPAEYAVMLAIGLVSFGLTVAGVTRQRRGGSVATAPRAAPSAGYPQ